MKTLTLIAALLFSIAGWSKQVVTFESLYRFSVMNRLKDSMSSGKCIDLKAHFKKSLSWVGSDIRNGEWRKKFRTIKEAKSFCSGHKENPLCEDLPHYLPLLEKENKKLKKHVAVASINVERAALHILSSVSRKDLITEPFFKKRWGSGQEYTTDFSCAENIEVDTALKYLYVINEKSWEGDSSISSKMIYKFEGMLDDFISDNQKLDYSQLDEMNDDCKFEALEVQSLMNKKYKESFVSICSESFRAAGFSIYDKKEMYCSGKTPLACRLSQPTSSRKTASAE